MRTDVLELDRRGETHVVDNEARRITEFIGVLTDVKHVAPIAPDVNMDDDLPVEYAKRRFLAFDFNNETTLFLDPSIIGSEGVDADETTLTFEPLVARSGKRSAHGVFFGRLQVGDSEIDVAVKPHTTNALKTGPDDYFKMAAVREEGFHTLTPIALLLADKDADVAYSMTLLEEGLTTLDSIDWLSFFPNITRNPGMQELWREVSGQVAILHSDGKKSHGDLAARNIAIHPDGAAFLIDWEYAYITGIPPRDAESRYNRSYSDLSTLLESMCLPPHANLGGVEGIGGKSGIGIFYGKEENWWEGFCDIFWDEYVHTRLQVASLGNHKGRALQEVKEELEELERSLQEDMRMMQDICASIPPLKYDSLTKN